MMPMFSVLAWSSSRSRRSARGGNSAKQVNDLVEESRLTWQCSLTLVDRQLLHKVHMKLRALRAPPSDTGAAAAAEGNAAKQAQKGRTSALQLWARPPGAPKPLGQDAEPGRWGDFLAG